VLGVQGHAETSTDEQSRLRRKTRRHAVEH
jgi:hypothetical protein